MFELREKTNRTICRVLFCALAVAPTLAVLVWAVAHHGPGRRERIAGELSQSLGGDIQLAGVAHPRPNVTRYFGTRLGDQFGAEPALATVVDGALFETRRDGDTLTIHGAGVRFDARRLARLLPNILRSLRRERTTARRVVFSASTLTVDGLPDGSITLSDVSLEFSFTKGMGAAGRFSLPDISAGDSARWQIAIDPQGRWSVSLSTGERPIPCVLLASVVEAFAIVGPRATFAGRIAARQEGSTWRGEATGVLAGVDLQRLVSEQFPHKLSGDARVEIRRCAFHGGRLESAALQVAAGPGVVGRSLIDSAADALKLTKPDDASINAVMPYERLAVGIRIDQHGLILSSEEQPGNRVESSTNLLIGEHGPLLWIDDAEPRPVVAIVRMLVPDNDVRVPATRETDELLRRLPLPRIVRRTTTEQPGGQLRQLDEPTD